MDTTKVLTRKETNEKIFKKYSRQFIHKIYQAQHRGAKMVKLYEWSWSYAKDQSWVTDDQLMNNNFIVINPNSWMLRLNNRLKSLGCECLYKSDWSSYEDMPDVKYGNKLYMFARIDRELP